METRTLFYFIAVAEERNIGRAAARLHITQPALTRQIHSLEEEVGVPLFLRTASGVEITQAGIALLQHARTIRAELEKAKTNAMHADDELRQPLDIGVYGSAILTIVPQVLRQFSRIHPNVEFILHNVRKDQQIELLRQGKILLALDRYLPREPDLICELVYREYMHVVLHKDHPLAKRDAIESGDLLNEPQIGGNLDRALGDNLSRTFGRRPNVVHRSDDAMTTLALVAGGLGVSFAPLSTRVLQVPDVVYRPYVGEPKVPIDLYCMYRKGDQSPLLHSFLEVIRAFRSAQEIIGD